MLEVNAVAYIFMHIWIKVSFDIGSKYKKFELFCYIPSKKNNKYSSLAYPLKAYFLYMKLSENGHVSRLAQLVERKALNLVVVGSSSTVGE